MDLSSLVLLATVSGYGDPVGGFPSHAERELLLWTNAARVAPTEFEDEYLSGYAPCSLDDFESSEKEAKNPLYIDLDLTEVARVHSSDMRETPCFQHESCDGTDTWTRIARYYDDTTYLGENIAQGTTDPRYAVMGMWMCSSGHRANIMTGDYNELGPGVDSDYMTQDFAAGILEEGDPPMRGAVDIDGVVHADWSDDDPPAALEVVVDGVEAPMDLAWGRTSLGIWTAEAVTTKACAGWYVYWRTAAGRQGTFPEGGSWQLGDCEDEWVATQAPRGGLFRDVPEDELKAAMLDDLSLVGCATGGPAGTFAALGALGLAFSRRRRS